MRPVPEYDAKSWLIKALRETAHAMESLLWDLGDDVTDRRPADDEWSCRELIGHMCEMERRYTDRLERMVRMESPAIASFDADSIEAAATEDDDAVFDLTDGEKVPMSAKQIVAHQNRYFFGIGYPGVTAGIAPHDEVAFSG